MTTVQEAGSRGGLAAAKSMTRAQRVARATKASRAAAKKRQLEIDRNLATALVSLNEKAEGLK